MLSGSATIEFVESVDCETTEGCQKRKKKNLITLSFPVTINDYTVLTVIGQKRL